MHLTIADILLIIAYQNKFISVSHLTIASHDKFTADDCLTIARHDKFTTDINLTIASINKFSTDVNLTIFSNHKTATSINQTSSVIIQTILNTNKYNTANTPSRHIAKPHKPHFSQSLLKSLAVLPSLKTLAKENKTFFGIFHWFYLPIINK